MSEFGDRLEASAKTTDFTVIPKGVYTGVLNRVAYNEKTERYGENVSLEFLLTGDGELNGRKVWSNCYANKAEGSKADALWKIAKNLKGLGLSIKSFDSLPAAAAAIETAGLSKSVDVEVTVYTDKNGKLVNDGFVKTLVDSDATSEDDIAY